jgi:hypothetical protein
LSHLAAGVRDPVERGKLSEPAGRRSRTRFSNQHFGNFQALFWERSLKGANAPEITIGSFPLQYDYPVHRAGATNFEFSSAWNPTLKHRFTAQGLSIQCGLQLLPLRHHRQNKRK